MNFLFRSLKSKGKITTYNNLVFFSSNTCLRQIPRPVMRKNVSGVKRIEPYGWFMLIIPVTSFGLGIWQIKRKAWKENLIAELAERTTSAPIELPENMDNLEDLEFHPVHVRGTFLHDKEMYLGPRTLVEHEDPAVPKHLYNMVSTQGYLVITPLKLENRDQTILVNRGWVTTNRVKPQTRAEGQVEGVVDVVGILRLNENRPTFGMKNQEGKNIYLYRDLTSMCANTGASPIFLDQTLDYNAPGGPIGGQTRVTLRNEHLSYILTWFSLSAATAYMWFTKYVRK